MAMQVLNNGETLGTIRGKINGNFSELDSLKVTASQVLTRTNTTTYTPTADYHPATKSYADGLNSTFKNVYDPTGISADAFDRDNHYGTIAPSVVVQDSENRFVTDDNIANWNQKEDNIGAKNTAFNKSFGTTTGTVATGDHTHTKQDIGLGNVDNTADADKVVSDATQTVLDLKADITYVDDSIANQVFDKIDFDYSSIPDRQEGRIFYDELNQSLSVYTDVADFTHNLGQEEVTRVYNATGSNIPNGTVCRGDGATGGSPNAAPALADNLANSTVIGIATHGIPPSTYGFVTHTGGLTYSIAEANIDETVYLSDTVAGGMTNIPPDIACVLGVKLTGNKMQVNIDNHRSLPTAIGWMTGIAATYDLVADGSWTPLVSWTSDDSIYMDVDPVLGTIEVPESGVFRVSVTFSATFTPDGKESRSFRMDLFDTLDNVEIANFSYPMPLDTASITGTFTAPFRTTAAHGLQLRIGTELEDVNGVVFNNINFSVESIQIK